MLDICSPALIYIVFSLTQIIIDIFQGMYNTAFMKLIVATLITILLDALCKRGLDVISWIIVFIPFIFMTVIVSVLLYIFGLNSDTGTNKSNNNKQVPYDFSNGNLIFTTSSNINTNSNNISSNINANSNSYKDSYYNSSNAPSLYETSDPYNSRLI
jgi:predicted PurR-regulated permease PerM